MYSVSHTANGLVRFCRESCRPTDSSTGSNCSTCNKVTFVVLGLFGITLASGLTVYAVSMSSDNHAYDDVSASLFGVGAAGSIITSAIASLRGRGCENRAAIDP